MKKSDLLGESNHHTQFVSKSLPGPRTNAYSVVPFVHLLMSVLQRDARRSCDISEVFIAGPLICLHRQSVESGGLLRYNTPISCVADQFSYDIIRMSRFEEVEGAESWSWQYFRRDQKRAEVECKIRPPVNTSESFQTCFPEIFNCGFL